jgi:hypothetical protein
MECEVNLSVAVGLSSVSGCLWGKEASWHVPFGVHRTAGSSACLCGGEGFQMLSRVATAWYWKNKVCRYGSSGSHGAVGPWGPACAGVWSSILELGAAWSSEPLCGWESRIYLGVEHGGVELERLRGRWHGSIRNADLWAIFSCS